MCWARLPIEANWWSHCLHGYLTPSCTALLCRARFPCEVDWWLHCLQGNLTPSCKIFICLCRLLLCDTWWPHILQLYFAFVLWKVPLWISILYIHYGARRRCRWQTDQFTHQNFHCYQYFHNRHFPGDLLILGGMFSKKSYGENSEAWHAAEYNFQIMNDSFQVGTGTTSWWTSICLSVWGCVCLSPKILCVSPPHMCVSLSPQCAFSTPSPLCVSLTPSCAFLRHPYEFFHIF